MITKKMDFILGALFAVATICHIISNKRRVFQLGICKTSQCIELVYKADIHYTYCIVCLYEKPDRKLTSIFFLYKIEEINRRNGKEGRNEFENMEIN